MAGTIAIDLGSTTTVVAFQPADGGAAELLALAPYSWGDPPVIPSLIWLSDAEASRPLIGRQVLEAGLLERGGPQLLRDFKREIGAESPPRSGRSEPPAPGPRPLLSPEQAGSLLLRHLWLQLPPQLQPTRLVLTAPIDGYRGYRRWLSQTCSQLNVPEVALVDEPTAAALGAGLAPGSRVLVVDLGGGTFDLSLVALEGGEGRAAPIAQLLRFGGRDLEGSRQVLRTARVLGKAGLACGGRDIDRWIAEALVPEAELQQAGLLAACERLKCDLSSQEQALVLWSPLPDQPPRELRLQRDQLQALLLQQGLLGLLDELLETVLASARAAGVQLRDIDAVLPVGGCSQLPLIRQWLLERTAGIPLRDGRPVEAVALGALSLTPGVAVKDVLSRGVSLRCWDQRSREHRWHPLFLPGQAWPSERPLELVLACSREGQDALEVVLGEPSLEQRSEVVFEQGLPRLRRRMAGAAAVDPWPHQPAALPLTPPGRQGDDRLRLRFRINTSGQLLLEGEDLATGRALEPQRLGPVR
jgi:molecular chaperone DnaK (HSP70)